MRVSPLWCIVCLLIPLGLLLGCDSAAKKKAAKGSVEVAAGKLPELDDYFPPLDGGRVLIAPPTGWDVPPRSTKYIARFRKSVDAKYPTIIVTADDFDQVEKVTDKNVKSFAKQLAAQFKKDGTAGKLVSPVKPVKIKHFVGATYRQQAKAKESISKVLERFFLATVVDGRIYTIELRTMKGSLDDDHRYVFAVACGMKFPKDEPVADTSSAEPAGAAEKAEEPPKAEAKKEEPKAEPKAEAKKEAPKAEPKAEAKKEAPAKADKKPEKKAKLDEDLKGLDEFLE